MAARASLERLTLETMRSSSRFWTILSILSVFAPARALAATYYVAPDASAGGDGTIGAPFASFAEAQNAASGGDIVYFRGGTYPYTQATGTCSGQTGTVNAITLTKSGSAGMPISYFAYEGETPVFDFSGMDDDCRITGLRVTGSFIHLKGLEITGVRQNNNLNNESWAIWNSGSNNTFELLNLHHNMGPGLFIARGGNNLVLNCDSHHNYDPNSKSGDGTNADGFGAHIDAGETGNVFRGCRAWFNTDDGYDLIHADEPVIFENSWAFSNGYEPDTATSKGDGNGFKAGGFGKPATDVPPEPPEHVIRFCVAFANKASGFYANHHPVANLWYNNTGFSNRSANYNMLGIAGDADVNVGFLRNNVAFGGTAVANGTGAGVDSAFNTWDSALGVTANAMDFVSTETTGWDAPRKPDGSLPDVTSMHLVAGSDLIDKGTDVMLPFAGSAPDLGAFETGLPAGSGGAGGAGGSSGGGGSANGGRDAGGSSGEAGTLAGRTSSGGNSGTANGGTPGRGTGGTAGANPAAGGRIGSAGVSASGGSGMNASGTSSVTGGRGSAAGAGGSALGGARPNDGGAEASGCGCRTAQSRTNGPALALGLLLVFGRFLRRSRRMPHPLTSR
jgi:MYXO-CTERM domain-containing protein